MAICNAFKQAQVPEMLDDMAFIRIATDKLLTTTDQQMDWYVLSLLMSTLNLITDKDVL